MWYCQNCGAANADGASFCVQCGTKREVPRPKKSRKGLLIAIIAALMVLALAAAAYFWIWPAVRDSSLFGGGKEKSSSRSDKDDDGGRSSSKTKLLGGRDGEWLLLREVSRDRDGDVQDEVTYEYGKYGAVNYESVYYFSYSNTVSRYRTSYEYDEKGNLAKSISFDGETGEPEEYTLFEYDRKGNCVKSSVYSSAGDVLQQYTLSEYDRDGNVLSSKTYDASDKLTARGERIEQGTGYVWERYRVTNGAELLEYHTEYDADDNITYTASYNKNGTMSYYYRYEYDKDGIKTGYSSEQFNDDGSLFFYVNSVLEYDSDGNMIREVSTFNDDWDSVHEYSYDKYGNAIQETSTIDGRQGTTTKSEYVFYRNGVEEERSGTVD